MCLSRVRAHAVEPWRERIAPGGHCRPRVAGCVLAKARVTLCIAFCLFALAFGDKTVSAKRLVNHWLWAWSYRPLCFARRIAEANSDADGIDKCCLSLDVRQHERHSEPHNAAQEEGGRRDNGQ